MSDPQHASLWWPGDHRAGDLMSDAALLRAMVEVEQAWLETLVAHHVAPGPDVPALPGLVDDRDLPALAEEAERSGNPVVPLVALLRGRAAGAAGPWLHRGLTSQDVLDSAVMLCARDAVARVRREVGTQVLTLTTLVRDHRDTAMVARTLTQHAVPTTFGLHAATWLHAVLDGDDDLAGLDWPVQLGGAAGTLSGVVELAGPERARQCRAALPAALGLSAAAPWHTSRAPLNRVGDAALRMTDAWGGIARDVLVLARPEVGELAEADGGGSSTMPQKANPVRATLLRRAALAAPALAATLHTAAADQVDARADGAWHVEWATLATLLRRAVVAAAEASDLLEGLRVHPHRMRARLADVEEDVLAEQRALAEVTGREPAASYTGLADDLADEALARAAARRPEEHP